MHLPIFFLLLLFSYSQSHASELNTYLEIGVHSDSFKLRLEDHNKDIENSFDKIEWNHWMSPEIRAGAIYRFCSRYSLEAEGGVQLRTSKKTIKGNQFSVALGYLEKITPTTNLTTLVGYSEQRTSFHAHSGNLPLKSTRTELHKVNLSNFHCANTWKGPWIGCWLNYFPYTDLTLFFQGEYHQVYYQSHSHWTAKEHLSDDFRFETKGSLSHAGWHPGIKVNGVIVKELAPHWKINLHGYYEQVFHQKKKASLKLQELACTPNGRVFSDGSTKIKSKSAVQAISWAILGGIDYEF